MQGSRKYIFAFLITTAIFATALAISNFFSQRRLSQIQTIQDRLALDILASETQSALLAETSCKNVVKNTTISKDIGDLAEKLAIAEEQNRVNNPDILNLKKQYSLLEIREYLLMKNISAKCEYHPTFIVYFYGDESHCPDCTKMGFVLTALHDEFPDLRIYSFDYNLDLEAIHCLRSIYGLKETLPAIVINGDPYYGFEPLDKLVEDVPALLRLRTDENLKRTTSSSAPSASR